MPRSAYKAPPLDFAGAPQAWIRRVALVVRGILNGQTNNLRDVTLAAGATTTTLTDVGITPNTAAVFCPLTAHAAAAVTSLWWDPGAGSAIIHHNNTADVDRSFAVILHG